jgi:hypothetical protein
MHSDDSPLILLRVEDEQINPAIILADNLMRRPAEQLLTVEEIEEAENILIIGTQEVEAVESHRKAFLKTPPSAVDYVPVGF